MSSAEYSWDCIHWNCSDGLEEDSWLTSTLCSRHDGVLHSHSFHLIRKSKYDNYVERTEVGIKRGYSYLNNGEMSGWKFIWNISTITDVFLEFILFWLRKTSVMVESFQLCFHVFMCAFHSEIVSFHFFGKSSLFLSFYPFSFFSFFLFLLCYVSCIIDFQLVFWLTLYLGTTVKFS